MFRTSALLSLVGALTGAPFAPLSLHAQASSVTFAAHVAPILRDHCASCHQPNGVAPFALLEYEDARPRARQIATAVARRTMPPWKPTGPMGTFLGDRRLTAEQIATLERWVADGAPRGESTNGSTTLPPASLAPVTTEGWQLGPPDLVVRLPSPYRLAAHAREQMRNMVVPVPLTEARFVRAWEFKTNAPSVVHHATLVVDPARAARRLDADDPEVGYEGLIPLSAQSPEGYFLGWTPGQQPSAGESDIAWRITPGSDLVALLHLRPGDRDELVDVSIGLYFSEKPPSRVPAMIRLNRQDLDIPAGATGYIATDRYTLPIDVDLHAIQPHAHYLARRVTGSARLPDGRTLPLIDIPEWDFHWQDAYRYAHALHLPAGTELMMEWTFDNSDGNRANPSRPSRRVTYGQRSSDEMADLWLQVVPSDTTTLQTLVTDVRRKMLPQNIQGYRLMLMADPNNATLHDDLALLSVEAGDLQVAAAEFEHSSRLRPQSAAARYNVGNALLLGGRLAEAESHFRQALTIDAEHGLSRQGLALALHAQGRSAESLPHLEAAVRLMPQAPDTRLNLGVVRQARGDIVGARDAYREATKLLPKYAEAHLALGIAEGTLGRFGPAAQALGLALTHRPRWPAAEAELAWVRVVGPGAGAQNHADARQLAADAVARSNRKDARALDVLAAVHAAEGRFDEAISTAEAALQLLSDGADDGRRDAVEARLDLYRQRRPYVWQPAER